MEAAATVLRDSLVLWNCEASLAADGPNRWLIEPAHGPRIAVTHHEPPVDGNRWSTALGVDPGGSFAPFSTHAGLSGLLRELRGFLAPERPAGRMIVGRMPLGGDAP